MDIKVKVKVKADTETREGDAKTSQTTNRVTNQVFSRDIDKGRVTHRTKDISHSNNRGVWEIEQSQQG